MRVLIVDDDRTSRLVLRRILEGIGNLEVSEAVDGLDALNMLSAGLAPGLSFIDINMARMSGLELLKRMRDDERMASLKVCICSAVKDRRVITQAAVLRPEHYILKPYSRAAIAEQIEKARGNKGISPDRVEGICSRLGIDRAAYAEMLRGLLGELRELSARISTLTTPADISAAVMALDGARSSAEILGVHQALALSEELSKFVKSCSAAGQEKTPKDGAAPSLPTWLARTTDGLAAAIEGLEREASRLLQPSGVGPDPAGPKFRPDLDYMIRFLINTLERGRLFSSASQDRVRALDLRIDLPKRAPDPGSASSSSGADAPLVITLLDDSIADAIEECCGTWDLQRLLSFPFTDGKRWISEGAIHLLEEETAHRNEHGIVLLRQAIGANVEELMAKREAWLRQKLDQLLAGQPELTPVVMGNLAEAADDASWAGPYSVLSNAARLFRNAARDSSFYRVFKFNTFYRESFIQAMDLFGDLMAHEADPDRALVEKTDLEAIASAPGDLREKCLKIWRLVRSQAPLGGSTQPRLEAAVEK
jgi:two-component system chemotaxis response regulator CheY